MSNSDLLSKIRASSRKVNSMMEGSAQSTPSAPSEDSPQKTPRAPNATPFVFNIISIYAPPESSADDTESNVEGRAGKSLNESVVSHLKAVILAKLPVDAPSPRALRTNISLGKIRAQLVNSYPGITPFRFCDEFGNVVLDSMTIGQYFDGLRKPPSEQDASFNIFVTAVSSGDPNQLIISLLKEPFLLKFMRLVDDKNSSNEGSIDSSVFKDKSVARTNLAIFRGLIGTMSVDANQDVFCLPDGTPIPDTMPLEQYLGMAKPAVQHKDKVPSIPIFLKKTSLSILQTTSELSGGSSERRTLGIHSSQQRGRETIDQSIIKKLGKVDHELTDRSKEELHRDKSRLQVSETLHEADYAAESGTTVAHANELNEAEWDLILKNSNALRGWIVDFQGNKIGRAPHPAFKLRDGLNLVKVTSQPPPEASDNPPTLYSESAGDGAFEDGTEQITGKRLQPLQSQDVKQFVARKCQAIPSFAVNDDCDIDVASVQHDFAYSMATNHFDKTIFEAEASGSMAGVTIGANGGVSTEKSSGATSSDKSLTKTLVATYNVPRATVYLPPEDLEPTEEFVAAINRVRETKNIMDLRKLHKTFGQIFCSEITIGGCLQTSKVLAAKEIAEETVQRSKFKGSVGVAVGFRSIASGSAKYSNEKQDHSEAGSTTSSQSETLSFRATGGNTVLAANPPAWLSSVASDHNTWRVILRGDMRPVMDIVSEIPGYEEVRMWFLQAAPKLTEYIVIPPSRTVDSRFKLEFGHQGLSRAFTGSESRAQEGKNTDGQADPAYLSHDPANPPTYFRTYVQQIREAPKITQSALYYKGGKALIDTTTKIYQTTERSTEKIFQPASTQAPVLFSPREPPQPDPSKPADSRTIWTIEVPYGYSLTHNSLVSVKSKAGKAGLTLSVYRNAQGVFMPAITDHPDPVYWRILKTNHSDASGSDQIKFGDNIRLCWRFSDQASGWRDYLDDFYGRRRFDAPAELRPDEDTLYLKAPFPRFEGFSDQQGMSMLLSTAKNTEPFLHLVTVLDRSAPKGLKDVTYNLFDLTFRLDYVGGPGELIDYMDASYFEVYEKYRETILDETKSDEQSVGGVLNRMVGRVTNSYVKQFDDLGNAVKSGSPVAIMKESFKSVLSFTPAGAVAKLFGFW